MKRYALLLCLALLPLSLTAQTPQGVSADSLAALAARGDVQTLRPLFLAQRSTLPPQVRLYCEVALAHADGRDERMTVCIDSLVGQYGRSLSPASRVALVGLKADALLRGGRYTEAHSYLREQLRIMTRRKFSAARTAPLRRYLAKAVSLSDTTARGRLLRLAAQGDAFDLLEAYRTAGNGLDTYARLVVSMHLDAAFGRGAEAAEAAAQLLEAYTDSLLPSEQAACATLRAEDILRRGDWQEGGRFVQNQTARSLLPAATLRLLEAAAARWADEAPTTLRRETDAAAAPLSRDWPLLVGATLEGKADVRLALTTAQRYTVVSAGDARAAGLETLDVTLQLPVLGQLTEARPALVHNLKIGGLTWENLLVYVVPDGLGTDGASLRLLGTDVLRPAGVAELREEKLVFPTPTEAQPEALPETPNLCFTPSGALRLHARAADASAASATQRFELDTSVPGSTLSAAAFPRGTVDTAQFRLVIADEVYTLPPLSYTAGPTDSDGLLGAAFLRGFARPRLNLLTMELQPGKAKTYRPRFVADYAASGDLMTLERNEAALDAVSDATERSVARLLVLLGKNAPAAVVEAAERLQPALRASELADVRHGVAMTRARSLAAQGRYAEAAEVCNALLATGAYTGEAAQYARARAEIYAAARPFGAPSLTAPGPQTAVRYAADGRTVMGLVNGHKAGLRVDPTEPYVLIPRRLARKLHVHLLHEAEDYAVGLVGSVQLGAYVLRDVLCRVADIEGRNVTVGYNALSLVPRLTLSAEGVLLATETPDARGGIPLRFDDHLCAQGDTPDGYVTLRLTTDSVNTLHSASDAPVGLGALTLPASAFTIAPATGSTTAATPEAPPATTAATAALLPDGGSVGLAFLLSHLQRLTFDFRHMRLH